jgi:hypothetical protein
LRCSKKSEWALQRGGRSAHSFSWLLSSPQQPLETEDPPTVSLAPQYTSQHLCRAIIIFLHRETLQKLLFCSGIRRFDKPGVQLFHPRPSKNFSIKIGAPNSARVVASTGDDIQDSSLPNSTRITSASALAFDFTSLSVSPSIITRASDSVPE